MRDQYGWNINSKILKERKTFKKIQIKKFSYSFLFLLRLMNNMLATPITAPPLIAEIKTINRIGLPSEIGHFINGKLS